ncbi:MAG: glycosyltransferase [Planctomycetota bacterium]|nr:glycosyltransferase [Planctomycetota bacterium]
MPPIPITYVVASMQTSEAGTEGHLLRLIRGLDRSRFSPRLIVLQSSQWLYRVQDDRVPVDCLEFQSFSRLRDWNCLGRLSRHFRQYSTQIVELHFTDAHFLGSLAARQARIPVVISCRRDLGHQHTSKSLLMTRFANPWISRFLANSHLVAERMSQREGVARHRFDVIPNGVDLAAFDLHTQREPSPEFLQATQGKRIVTLLANLRPVKNVQGFLAAAQQVASIIPDVCFVILGQGEQADALRAQAEQLGIARSICWMGSVTNPAAYLAHSHVGCLTSHAEGFSNAIVEYMAAGIPVVATRVGGAEEAIVEGITGHLVDPNDMPRLAQCIANLLQDETRRSTMGRASRQRVEELFTHQIQLAAYQAYYERLLKAADQRELA